jgi:hypothetical protein
MDHKELQALVVKEPQAVKVLMDHKEPQVVKAQLVVKELLVSRAL